MPQTATTQYKAKVCVLTKLNFVQARPALAKLLEAEKYEIVGDAESADFVLFDLSHPPEGLTHYLISRKTHYVETSTPVIACYLSDVKDPQAGSLVTELKHALGEVRIARSMSSLVHDTDWLRSLVTRRFAENDLDDLWGQAARMALLGTLRRD